MLHDLVERVSRDGFLGDRYFSFPMSHTPTGFTTPEGRIRQGDSNPYFSNTNRVSCHYDHTGRAGDGNRTHRLTLTRGPPHALRPHQRNLGLQRSLGTLSHALKSSFANSSSPFSMCSLNCMRIAISYGDIVDTPRLLMNTENVETMILYVQLSGALARCCSFSDHRSSTASGHRWDSNPWPPTCQVGVLPLNYWPELWGRTD